MRDRAISILMSALFACSEEAPQTPADAASIDAGVHLDAGLVLDVGVAPDGGDTTPDAEPIDLGVAPDGGGDGGCTVSGTVAVTGSWIDQYFVESGAISVARDLTPVELRVLVENTAQNCFAEIEVRKNSAGELDFSGLPPGPYYLSVLEPGETAPVYYVTDATSFALGRPIQGRPNLVLSEDPRTTLSFDVDQLAPFAASDQLMLVSFDASVDGFSFQSALSPPLMKGATTLRGQLPYATLFSPFLIDADPVYLYQNTTIALANGDEQSTIVRFMAAPLFTMTDGADHEISGSFEEVPPTFTGSFDWRRSSFNALASVHYPGASDQTFDLFVSSTLGAGDGYFLGLGGVLESRIGSDRADLTHDYAFGNPFPAGATLSYSAGYETPIPNSPFNWFSYMFSAMAMPAGNALIVVEPLVGPAGDIEIGEGDAPIISWRAPETGIAHAYYVSIREIIDGSNPELAFRAGLWTTDTQVRLPPGVLNAGSRYFVRVVSQHGPNIDFKRQSQRFVLPYAYADALVPPFTR